MSLSFHILPEPLLPRIINIYSHPRSEVWLHHEHFITHQTLRSRMEKEGWGGRKRKRKKESKQV